MEKGTKSIIACFIPAITILLMSAIWSCGKRITSTTRTEIKRDSLSIENSIELTQNTTMANIGTLRPLDNSKPMLWNGKWYYNTVIDFDKSISSGSILKMNENLSYTGSEEKKKGKEILRTNKGHIVAIISLIVSIFALIYVLLKKYKIL